MDISGLQDILSAGGDTATILLLWVMWKFDRRLLRMETKLLIKEGDI